jgi:hypothetical protein
VVPDGLKSKALPRDMASCAKMFIDSSKRIWRVFIVLDGLDECDKSQIGDLTAFLQCLVEGADSNVQLFCTARPEFGEPWPLSSAISTCVQIKPPIDDVRIFVESTLQRRIKVRSLKPQDQQEIAANIMNTAKNW